jgi:hypothetical protein
MIGTIVCTAAAVGGAYAYANSETARKAFDKVFKTAEYLWRRHFPKKGK